MTPPQTSITVRIDEVDLVSRVVHTVDKMGGHISASWREGEIVRVPKSGENWVATRYGYEWHLQRRIGGSIVGLEPGDVRIEGDTIHLDGEVLVNGADIGTGGASALADLTDVDLTGLADGDVIAYNLGDNKWKPGAQSGGGATPTVVTVNVTTTLGVNDTIALVTGSPAVSLPATHLSGQMHEVKDAGGTAGTAAIVINGNTSLIDGAATASLDTNRQALRFVSDGTNWHIL